MNETNGVSANRTQDSSKAKSLEKVGKKGELRYVYNSDSDSVQILWAWMKSV